MRVALCFYGTLGGIKGKAGDKEGSPLSVLEKAFPHYKERILDKNKVDVFIHSWDKDVEKNIISKYNPTNYKFESQKIFDIPSHMKNTQRVQNHFSRWYSCKESLELKRLYELENNIKYDMVMLTRQDIAWNCDVNFTDFDNSYFYVPEWNHHHTGIKMGYPEGGYNKSLQDFWCFSNSKNMDILGELFDNIPSYCLENKELTAHGDISNHRLLYYKLCKMDIIPNKLKFAFKFDRPELSDMPLVRWKYFDEPTDYRILDKNRKKLNNKMYNTKDTLSIVKNFILFNDDGGNKRLNHLKSYKGIESFGKTFPECNFYINYKTSEFLNEIKTTYKKHVKHLNLYNNIETSDFNWALHTLALIKEVPTPYVMLTTEDRMFYKTNPEEFNRVITDIIKNNVWYMPVGKLDHLSVGSRYATVEDLMKPTPVHGQTCIKKYKDSGEELFLFEAKDAPVKITSFSADAIYKKELIVSKLEEMLTNYTNDLSPNNRFSKNTSKFFEDYYTDKYGNGVRHCGSMICAVPKREIVVSDETPGETWGK